MLFLLVWILSSCSSVGTPGVDAPDPSEPGESQRIASDAVPDPDPEESGAGSISLILQESESDGTSMDQSTISEETTMPHSGESRSETEDPSAQESSLPETSADSARSNPKDVYDATGFVDVSEVIPDIVLEIRYYTTYNFVGERIRGYEEPIALLSKEAAAALKQASELLKSQGYLIKIYDAYRPQTAVDHFVEWASDPDDMRMKEYFYPEVDKSRLFAKGYIAKRSGHSRGCKVDVTLLDMNTGAEVDMGGPFDYFGERSHPDYKGITDEQYQNRMVLRNAMIKCGFDPCATEWWDFSLKDEPYPNTYFAFPVARSSLAGTNGEDMG